MRLALEGGAVHRISILIKTNGSLCPFPIVFKRRYASAALSEARAARRQISDAPSCAYKWLPLLWSAAEGEAMLFLVGVTVVALHRGSLEREHRTVLLDARAPVRSGRAGVAGALAPCNFDSARFGGFEHRNRAGHSETENRTASRESLG
jgi:hypothetical protein